MTPDARQIVFENVSKFYGEVLGVNKVSFSLEPGITSLVGPNGSGKTTLMNLLTGLIKPSQGAISVLGLTPQQPIEFFRQVGYCTQFDSFPPGTNGYDFIYWPLRLHGFVGEFLRLGASKTVQTQRPIDEVVAIRARREGVKLRAVTDLAEELDWLLRGEAEDADCALRRFDQTGQQVH